MGFFFFFFEGHLILYLIEKIKKNDYEINKIKIGYVRDCYCSIALNIINICVYIGKIFLKKNLAGLINVKFIRIIKAQ